jgi:farnesyl diphosphate synthase
MRYAVLGGGKRVRPLLAFAAGEVTGADVERVQHAAAAVELIHAYSLVHDDMPAWTTTRCGAASRRCTSSSTRPPRCWWAMRCRAWRSTSSHHRLADDAATQLEDGAAAGAGRRLARHGRRPGDRSRQRRQAARPDRTRIHAHPQDRRADPRLGAARRALRQRAVRPTAAALDHYAKCIGLAFQVVDDVLDAEAPTATLGKTAGKDAANNKPTYVSLLGAARARELAQELRADAHAALADLGAPPAAAPAGRLRGRADILR